MGESQRLMWVMVSVALLVVVVLAGGLYWLRPTNAAREFDGAAVPAFDPYEFVRSDEPAPGLLPQPESGDAAGGAFLAGESPGEPALPATAATEVGDLGIGRTSAPLTSVTRNGKSVSIARRTVAGAGANAGSALVTPDERGAGTLAPIGAASMASSASGSALLAPQTTAGAAMEFWIQVASFTSRGRADAEDQRLHTHGLASRITTRADGDQLFYRVRVGPYANQREAEKFLGWLRSVDGLDSSYILRVY